ncbi:2Fe-2S iron-sulfur cluster-binding protein [Alteromonas sp. KUL49]|uniref:2Fe-2S iron-sulfur cluster-binding protein n=1 Tax=Alteromonas sp. KUL49 TaxID=2480798 RepID=UPI00102F152B|nr:2Fe-2S iron-sulfur cluster-binding protein [Alteromonas sp. KUL49]TAP40143.1 2Fe-2S iron-sulfur cluster binding domain-containing protein [Alteromonas sp. KUL49]GEA11258.1 ferredoxin [Alteromonas sp. KUL49]
MTQIIFITADEQEHVLEADSGSLMELAVANNIAGIDGDCGGVCSCATCHVHIAPEDKARVGEASEIEADMLELAENVTENSRLCCQIAISDKLEGIRVTVAEG